MSPADRASLKDVKVPVDIVLGSTELTVEELTMMCEGSVIELEKLAGAPVEVRAAGSTVAAGEVIIVDENLGVRITSVATEKV